MKKLSIIIVIITLIIIFFIGFFTFPWLESKPKIFRAHNYCILTITFSNTGNILCTGSQEDTRLWDFPSLKQIGQYQGCNGVLSSNGMFLATINNDYSKQRLGEIVNIWDFQNGKNFPFLKHSGRIWSLAIAPKGDFVVTGMLKETHFSGSGEAIVWKIKTGMIIKFLKGHKDTVCSVGFSPGGEIIATGSFDNKVNVWDAKSFELKMDLIVHQGPVFSLAFSPNGTKLASSSNGNIIIWDLNRKKIIGNINAHPNNKQNPISLTFHPNGRFLASSSKKESIIKIWELGTNKLVCYFRKNQPTWSCVDSIAFTPDGNSLVAGVKVGEIEIWEVPKLISE